MKAFDEKDPHFKMCVAKKDAIERQKKIVTRLEAELDAEIDRQHKLTIERAAAVKLRAQKALVNKTE